MAVLSRGSFGFFWLLPPLLVVLWLSSQVNADHDFVCEGTDCLPNGECSDQTLHCVCQAGFYGELCDVTSCPLTCQNGGTCQAKDGSGDNGEAECACLPGFSGNTCQVCPDGTTCQNGGTCVVEVDDHAGVGVQYRCQCLEGFDGASCQNVATPPLGSSSSGDKEDGHLSAGAVAGIVLVVVLCALGGGAFLLLRRKRQRNSGQTSEQHHHHTHKEQDGASASGNGTVDDPANLPSLA